MIHAPADKAAVLSDLRRLGCRVVASERFVDEHGLWEQAVEIAGQAMVTDMPSTFDGGDCDQDRRLRHVGEGGTDAYEEAQVGARRRRRLSSCTTASARTS